MADFKNFLRAGVLKNKFRTTIVVPFGTPTSLYSISFPPWITYLIPVRSVAVFVIISVCETAAIVESASPRKPSDRMEFKSSACSILLVA